MSLIFKYDTNSFVHFIRESGYKYLYIKHATEKAKSKTQFKRSF